MKERILLAGVIGDPIAHSKSPKLHGHWLQRYGIDGHYVPLHVKRDDFAAAIAMLPKLGFRGANVTIPHKEAAVRLADRVTDRAALIGAANTLTVMTDGRIQADNTDGFGFLANIRQSVPGWSAASGPALVIGAGGAARAVVSALLSDGAPEVCVVNRTRSRAEALAQNMGARVKVSDWHRISDLVAQNATIVNTTSLGMDGQEPLNVNFDKLTPGTIVNDLVYTPLQTQFLAMAHEAGGMAVDGLGMLLHQAAPGFERWFGKAPEVDDELRAVVLGS